MNADGTSLDSLKGAFYSPRQVALASFIGSPLAGAWLLRANYRLLGDNGAAARALMWSFAGTILVFIAAWYVPDNAPNYLLPALYMGAMQWAAERYQGDSYRLHISAGGHQHSWWRVVGIGIVALIPWLVLFLVLFVSILP
jgi:hypothetical protein